MNKDTIRTILFSVIFLVLGYWVGQINTHSFERSCHNQGGDIQWLGKWNDSRYRVLICEFPDKEETSYPWDKPGREFEDE